MCGGYDFARTPPKLIIGERIMYLNRIMTWIVLLAVLTACGGPLPQQEKQNAAVSTIGTTGSTVPSSRAALEQPTASPVATLGSVGENRVGDWEVAYQGVEKLPQYKGVPAAEGHTFYGVNMLVANVTDQPIFFDSPNNGASAAAAIADRLLANWKTSTYSHAGIICAFGFYVPPGWPIRLQVVFDLPLASPPPVFMFQTPPSPEPTPQRIVPKSVAIDTLPSQLAAIPSPVARLATPMIIPDWASITPTGVDVIPAKAVGGTGELVENGNLYQLAVTATVKNLGGSEIMFPDIACYMRFQIFVPTTDGIVVPYSVSGCNSTIIAYNKQGRFFCCGNIPRDSSKELLLLPLTVNEKPALPPIMLIYFPPRTPNQTATWALYDLTGNGVDILRQPLVSERAKAN
jgi:hypothetical protein